MSQKRERSAKIVKLTRKQLQKSMLAGDYSQCPTDIDRDIVYCGLPIGHSGECEEQAVVFYELLEFAREKIKRLERQLKNEGKS